MSYDKCFSFYATKFWKGFLLWDTLSSELNLQSWIGNQLVGSAELKSQAAVFPYSLFVNQKCLPSHYASVTSGTCMQRRQRECKMGEQSPIAQDTGMKCFHPPLSYLEMGIPYCRYQWFPFPPQFESNSLAHSCCIVLCVG